MTHKLTPELTILENAVYNLMGCYTITGLDWNGLLDSLLNLVECYNSILVHLYEIRSVCLILQFG